MGIIRGMEAALRGVLLVLVAGAGVLQVECAIHQEILEDPVIEHLRAATNELAQKAAMVEKQAQRHAAKHNNAMSAAVAEKNAAMNAADAHAKYIEGTLDAPPEEDTADLDVDTARGQNPAAGVALVKATSTDEAARELESELQNRIRKARASSDAAAAASMAGAEAKIEAQNELEVVLQRYGLSSAELKAGKSPAAMQATLDAQKDTTGELMEQRRTITTQLDKATTLMADAMKNAAKDPLPENRLAAQVAAVQQHTLQKEQTESDSAIQTILSQQQSIRSRMKKTQVESALASLQLKGSIGPDTLKLIAAKAANSQRAADLAEQAEQHAENLKEIVDRIDLEGQAAQPVVRQAAELLAKAKGMNDGNEKAVEERPTEKLVKKAVAEAVADEA